MLKNASRSFKIIMCLLFIAMVSFSLIQLFQQYHTYKIGKEVQATIVQFVEKRSNPQSITNEELAYAPVIRFSTEEGKLITITSGNFSEKKKHALGDQIPVYYSKENPFNAEIGGEFPWTAYLSLTILGMTGITLLYFPTSKSI